MSSLGLALAAATAQVGERAICFHCGEPVDASSPSVPDGAEPAFCCKGCAAAAQWIRDADLGDYYRLRSQLASRVSEDAVDLAMWDRGELLVGHILECEDGNEITLLADGMRCAACAWLVDRALAREPGVLEVSANAITGRIRLSWDPTRTHLSQPLRRLVALGYRPYLAAGEEHERARRSERNRWLLRVGIAGLGAMQAMMFADALYFDTAQQMTLPMRDFLRWVTFLIATPVVFFSGWPFLAGAWHELRQRQLGMDTLIAGSTLLAYTASLLETIRGGTHVWYDAAVMFVFLLLVARMLEQRARALASAQVDALARARPAFATRELGDGGRELVALTALEAGDIACVAAGQLVPADGVLLDDHGCFEEALLTGESRPVEKPGGAQVFAGTICRERPARIRLTEVGSSTRLSQLTRLVERAQAHRPALARIADQVASRFVIGLLLVAAATWLAWHWQQPARAFEVTLALLVISCPCAMSLSVPAALAAAHGALAREGVLAVRPEALERLALATDIVFDKTGTLSDGQLVVAEVRTFDAFDRQQALRIAAALERDSGHPLAAAFKHVDSSGMRVERIETVAGAGVKGCIDGIDWRLGHACFATGGRDDEAIWLGDGSRATARFVVRDSERADATTAVTSLRALGIAVHLSSGDARAPVARLAQLVGIADPQSRQSPEDKLALVRGLQQNRRVVLMVGDGINDAPVLAGADVSIAFGAGAALAQQAADLVLTGNSLMRIPEAIAIARRTRKVIRQNLGWAIAYNLLALPVAAAGLVAPWMAAVGMAMSSLLVTANSLRLARRRAR